MTLVATPPSTEDNKMPMLGVLSNMIAGWARTGVSVVGRGRRLGRADLTSLSRMSGL
jgi:hypothetical protein